MRVYFLAVNILNENIACINNQALTVAADVLR
jgi:hypothetical protein